MPQYIQQELQKLFDLLPAELKSVILSIETADRIRNVCQRYQILEEDMSELAGLVGDVLMGLLPPQKFLNTLKEEFDLDEEKAEAVFREINRFIFFPVKNFLDEFYPEIKFAPGGRIEVQKPEVKLKEKGERGERGEKGEKGEMGKMGEMGEIGGGGRKGEEMKGKEMEEKKEDIYKEPIEEQ